jgi:hypothetical protein
VATPLLILVSSFQTNNVFGEKVDGLYYSVEIPETWTYTQSPESSIKELLGVNSYSSIVLVPMEFGTFLIENDDIEMGNGSAAIVFARDFEYSLKNAPIDLYVKFKADREDFLNTTTIQDAIIDNEKAVRIEGIKDDISGNLSTLDYLLLHNNEPYQFRYIASPSDYDKYLPEFETMVKSFKFKD